MRIKSHPVPRQAKLGVLVPLANEEVTIRDFLQRVTAQLCPQDRLFCVLDNLSKDQTKAIIAEGASRDPRIVLVWAPENRCLVDAYFAGYRAAFNDGCDWILEMDGGFSHLPEEIPLVIQGMMEGYDYVGGSRFMAGGAHNSPISRVILSKGGTWLAQWLVHAKMTDMCSGFECFNRPAMDAVLKRGVVSKANFFQTEIRLLMHHFKWREVPIHYRNENYRVGRSSVREALRILFQLRREQRQAKRNL